MQKIFRLFLFLLAVSIVPVLCQANTIILSNLSPDHTVTSTRDENVYGTSTANTITLESGAKAELTNFPGQNNIQLQSTSDLFTVSRSGTVVTFQGSDGTILKIPATTAIQTISFNDEESRVLQIHNNQVVLDDQVIDINKEPIAANYLTYLTITEVSQLYVAIFNLASTGQANTYWRESGADMSNTANAMLDSDFYNSFFGASLDSDQAFVEHIYLNTMAKTADDDPYGIAFWVHQLEAGASRGELVANLVDVIENYGPGGAYYDPDDVATVAAYNQFVNRVEVSNYMAANVQNPPTNYRQATAFDADLVVTDEVATVTQAKGLIDIMSGDVDTCGAYIAPGVWKQFDCYNLAAIGKENGEDPFTPSWSLIGGYWQWGRKGPDSSVLHTANTSHFAHGPTGPDSAEANSGGISGWDQTNASDGAWSDSHKTANDPCPAGYRVPTRSQWDGVRNNDINPQRTAGARMWTSSDTNYTNARFFGDDLMLPAAGNRLNNGLLVTRGGNGSYWSSSENSIVSAWGLMLGNGNAIDYSYDRLAGVSVRCIKE